MNRPDVPVTLPRARFEVDSNGHLAVQVDGQPWQPPTGDATAAGPGVPLGRSDVPWVKQQIADDLGTPVLVVVVDDGQSYSDFVDPDGYQLADPGRPELPAATDTGRYTPGEPVVISVVVDRVRADEHGNVRYRLPAALGDRDVVVHGETSGTTLPLAPSPPRATDVVQTPSSRSPIGRGLDARRSRSGSGHAPQSAGPAPTRGATPDAGLGAL